jgi:hypothetical protein
MTKTTKAKRASRPKKTTKAKRASRPKKTTKAKRASRPKKTTAVAVIKTAPEPESAKKTTAMAVIKTAPELEISISWDDALAEGKRLVAEGEQIDATADRNDWQLAALADQVVKDYHEDKLGQFAKEIGLAHCTIKRRRQTYRHWKEILKGDPGLLSSLSYSVARELEKHPDRERLFRENRKMTKREASALVKAYREKPENETERRWRDVIVRAGKALANENFLNVDREILPKVVDPAELSNLREAAQAWIRTADGLEKLFKPEPANEEAFDTADA